MSDLSAANLVQQGLAYHQQGELDTAEAYYQQALEKDPTSFNALHFFGMAEFQRGESAAAERLIELSIELRPDSAMFRYNYGQFLESQGRTEEAIWAYDLALTLDPGMAAALNEKGRIQHQAGQEAAAENAFREAIALDPHQSEAYINLSGVLRAKEDLPGALEKAEQACNNDPGRLEAHLQLVGLLDLMGRPGGVISAVEEARRNGISHNRLEVMQANSEQELGQAATAAARLKRVLNEYPDNIEALYYLAQLAKRLEGPFPWEEAEALLQHPRLSREDRGILCFALGAYADSERDYDQAFLYWLEGNQVEAERAKPSQTERLLGYWHQLRQLYTADFTEQLAQWGYLEEAPIFVVGTPRSGTTLIEQILASHSRVAGVGESGLVEQVVREYLEENEEYEAEEGLSSFPPERLAELGRAYLSKLRELAPKAERIVEKTPANVGNLGLIRALFPNARVVLSRRDPLDSGVSMFSLRFNQIDFSFDLETLGRYLHGYQQQAAHWESVLPSEFLLSVDYEELVTEPETQIRRLLDHCGLDWEPGCLRFFETERAIRTASKNQARQPIYQHSVARWPRYASHLLPMARAAGLEDRLPQEAREGFRSFSRLGENQWARGDVQDAIASLRRALMWEVAHRPGINARLGQALESVERFREAEACFGLAQETGLESLGWTGDPDWQLARIRCLRKAGDLDEAYRLWSDRAYPRRPEEQIEAGWLAWANGDLASAEAGFEEALAASQDLEAWEGWVQTLRSQGRGQELQGMLERWAENRPEASTPARLLSDLLREQGSHEEAEQWARQAVDMAPGDHKALTALAGSLFKQGRLEEAAQAAEYALEWCPDHFPSHLELAHINDSQGRFPAVQKYAGDALGLREDPEARRLFGKALLIEGEEQRGLAEIRKARQTRPENHRFWVEEVVALEELNRRGEAKETLRQAKVRFPEAEHLHFQEFRILRREGEGAEVLEGLLNLTGSIRESPHYQAELGFLYDRQGDSDRAFSWFQMANQRFAQLPKARRYPKEPSLSRIARLRSTMTSEWVQQWRTPSQSTGWAHPPVFLLGFPRSGTTLLDQILSSHSWVEVLEEKPVFDEALAELRRRYGGDLKGLAQMDATDIRQVQEFYRDQLEERSQDPDARVIVDKLPLRTIEAGMVYRVFPDARFIFARRHPADCVLSAFMQLFQPNTAMANFHSLEDGARFYRAVMELWDQYRQLFPGMQVHDVRYEELLEDFDGVVQGLLAFLGLEWEEGVREYRQKALNRGRVRTPSRTQVTQPLYTHARYRWRGYRSHFGSAWEDLRPFMAPFGYPEE